MSENYTIRYGVAEPGSPLHSALQPKSQDNIIRAYPAQIYRKPGLVIVGPRREDGAIPYCIVMQETQ